MLLIAVGILAACVSLWIRASINLREAKESTDEAEVFALRNLAKRQRTQAFILGIVGAGLLIFATSMLATL